MRVVVQLNNVEFGFIVGVLLSRAICKGRICSSRLRCSCCIQLVAWCVVSGGM
jgi:hypothetical protein